MKKKKKQPPNILQKIRSNFLTGLVLITPIVLTLYLVWGAINFIDDKVVPWLPAKYNPAIYIGKDLPGLGVLTFLIFTTIVGMITKGFFGRQLIRFWESLVDRTPIFRSIYSAVKQIAETVFTKSDQTFQSACLVEYPRKGIWVVAFVSTESKEIKSVSKDFGAEIIDRPSSLALDESSEWEAWQHAVKHLESKNRHFDYFLSLPPTAPLRQESDVLKCFDLIVL